MAEILRQPLFSPDSCKLPEISLDLALSMDDDLASASDRTSASETTTSSERHDSARTSICSSDTSSSSASNTISSKKARKHVRFEESVCCSYFDENNRWTIPQPEPEPLPPQPQLRRKTSLMSRSWARIKLRNFSSESDVGSACPAPNLEQLKSGNYSADALEIIAVRLSSSSGGGGPGRGSISAVAGGPQSPIYSIRQPLRESAGRRYNRAQTTVVCWKATAPAAKGDWGDLLGTRTQRPEMNRALTY